jgi:hypothetical protein
MTFTADDIPGRPESGYGSRQSAEEEEKVGLSDGQLLLFTHNSLSLSLSHTTYIPHLLPRYCPASLSSMTVM